MSFETDTSELRQGGRLFTSAGSDIAADVEGVIDSQMIDFKRAATSNFREHEASGSYRDNITLDFNSETSSRFQYEGSRQVRFDVPHSYAELGTGERGLDGDDLDYMRTVDGSVGYESPDEPPPFDVIYQWARDRGVTPIEYNSFYAMVDAIRYTIADKGTNPVKSVVKLWPEQKNIITTNVRSAVRDAAADFRMRQKRVSST